MPATRGAQPATIAGTGHIPHTTQPDQWVATLLDFHGRLAMIATRVVALASLRLRRNKGTIQLADYQERANAICGPAIAVMNDVVQPVIETTLATMGTQPFDRPTSSSSIER